VQCGHGATAGDLDEDLLFYLRARGIPHDEAEALLIQAFVGDAIEGIEHAGLREALIEGRERVAQGARLKSCTRSHQRLLRRRADPQGFSRACHAGLRKPLVYLDNAASAQNRRRCSTG